MPPNASAPSPRIHGKYAFGVLHIVEAWSRFADKPGDHTLRQLQAGEMRVSDLRPEDRTEVLSANSSGDATLAFARHCRRSPPAVYSTPPMTTTYRSADGDTYRMDSKHPHESVEPQAQEIAVVDGALQSLHQARILPHTAYDHTRMLAHRQAVRDLFEIPWTAITPRMQRLIYAINAITQPATMVAAGVFCGNTFISNAGAAVGPGACYRATQLVGIEIKPAEAERAERNVRKIDPTGVARVVAADAVEYAAAFQGPIHLLYLDADGTNGRGKGVYLDILQACWDRIPAGGLVLAHNSVNCAEKLSEYLAYVRDPTHCHASVNVVIDGEGLEVSAR